SREVENVVRSSRGPDEKPRCLDFSESSVFTFWPSGPRRRRVPSPASATIDPISVDGGLLCRCRGCTPGAAVSSGPALGILRLTVGRFVTARGRRELGLGLGAEELPEVVLTAQPPSAEHDGIETGAPAADAQ